MATEVESSSSKLLCVVCRCEHMEPEYFMPDDYHIFILDLNDADGNKGYVKMAPNLRLQGFSRRAAVCNVGSDLYIFDITGDCNVYKYTIPGNAAQKLSEIVVQDHKLMVTKNPYPKLGVTTTIPTPDGKILVLSESAYFYGSDEKSYHELYDPETNVWKLLPQLCIRPSPSCPSPSSSSPVVSVNFEVLDSSSGSWTTFTNATISKYNIPSYRSSRYSIQECCFISESTLLVRVMSEYFHADGHLVTLNIHRAGWKLFDEWEFLNMYPGRFVHKMLVVGNRLFLDGRGGIDISSKSPVNVVLPRSDGKLPRKMVVTDYVEDKECCFATVFSSPGFGSRREGRLVVDEFVYDFALGKCTPKIKDPFCFITADKTDLFFTMHAFMLPPTPIRFNKDGSEEKDSIFDARFGEMVLA